MASKIFSVTAAAVLLVWMNVASAPAQTAPDAKPSPYEGVSNPPPNDTIVTNDDDSQAPPPPAASAAAAQPSPKEAQDKASQPETPPQLAKRSTASPADSGAEIVTTVPGPDNALPEGTVFRVYLLGQISAAGSPAGTPFVAKLSQDLMYNGKVAVPEGSELRGEVTYASTSRRIEGRSLIHLVPAEFVLPDGSRYRVHAEVIDTAGSDTKATGEGDITSTDGKRGLLLVAASTGGGALAGAAVAGPVGAAVGSAVGAGFMGAHWLLANHSTDVPQGSTLVFSLTSPMLLTPVQEATDAPASPQALGSAKPGNEQ